MEEFGYHLKTNNNGIKELKPRRRYSIYNIIRLGLGEAFYLLHRIAYKKETKQYIAYIEHLTNGEIYERVINKREDVTDALVNINFSDIDKEKARDIIEYFECNYNMYNTRIDCLSVSYDKIDHKPIYYCTKKIDTKSLANKLQKTFHRYRDEVNPSINAVNKEYVDQEYKRSPDHDVIDPKSRAMVNEMLDKVKKPDESPKELILLKNKKNKKTKPIMFYEDQLKIVGEDLQPKDDGFNFVDSNSITGLSFDTASSDSWNNIVIGAGSGSYNTWISGESGFIHAESKTNKPAINPFTNKINDKIRFDEDKLLIL